MWVIGQHRKFVKTSDQSRLSLENSIYDATLRHWYTAYDWPEVISLGLVLPCVSDTH